MLSPLFFILIIFGFAIMRGNPFFCQERPGLNEKVFKLIKFRSMTEAKDSNGNLLPDGDRYTKYGLFLRKTSLDELPELLNILKGDMSIIGPRPLLVQYLELYTKEEKHRHDVKPGLTGLAQANGRNFLTWEQVFAYDLEYVQNITFINDIKIIFKTINEVISHNNVEDRSDMIEKDNCLYIKDGDSLRRIHAPLDEERKYKNNKEEIGSDFWKIELQKNDNGYFGDKYQWFISGRMAFNYILKDIAKRKKINSIAIPSWCCDTMIDPIIKNNIDVLFYSVTFNDDQLVKNINVEADVLLDIDYFGYKTKTIGEFKGITIYDASHSIFSHVNEEADYIFGSLRKWSGFVTGGFAYCKNGFIENQEYETNSEYINIKKKAMSLKEEYILGKIDNKDYLDYYKKAEAMLPDLYSHGSYEEDIKDAKYFNADLIRRIRIENARELLKYVGKYAMFKTVSDKDCPLFVPIIVPNGKRNELRNYLIENRVYCPIHWPISDVQKVNDEEMHLYNDELSLICDQRYNKEDMIHIGKLIEDFLKC